MKNARRMFAFISALALAFSYNAPSFVAIALYRMMSYQNLKKSTIVILR